MAQAPLSLNKATNPLDDKAPPAPEPAEQKAATPAPINVSPAPERKPVQAITVNNLRQAQAEFRHWHLTVTAQRDPADLADPQFWAHVASVLKPKDEITVDWEDGSRWMKLRVIDAGPNWAKVSVWAGQELEPRLASEVSIGGFRVSWGGLIAKYRVYRASDKAVIKDGMATMAEAVQFAEQEIRRQSTTPR